ncbi:MAG: helix-turn-helix transcriptional regulator [Gemmatimonadetes bacterium]|nr:helix-turn-helix transcriptional regulator [Gemmatimonadota bacterium]
MYGTSLLWRHWIERMRRQKAGVTGGLTLAQARVRAGLSQSQVARRLGISQADVSKLERRADLRLSTLRAFAGSIGARLYVALQGADDHVPRPLVLPDPSRARTLVSPAQGGSA